MGEMITFSSNAIQASGYLAAPSTGGPGLAGFCSNPRVRHPQAAAPVWTRTTEFLRKRLA